MEAAAKCKCDGRRRDTNLAEGRKPAEKKGASLAGVSDTLTAALVFAEHKGKHGRERKTEREKIKWE